MPAGGGHGAAVGPLAGARSRLVALGVLLLRGVRWTADSGDDGR
jgi:hypothetical protein